jgi:XamI restriction endonuclease
MTAPDPIRWTDDQLEADRHRSIEVFRRERLEEEVTHYTELFDRNQGTIEELLEATVDLTQLSQQAMQLLAREEAQAIEDDGDVAEEEAAADGEAEAEAEDAEGRFLQALRYLAAPPISEDDLEVLVSSSLSPASFRRNTTLAARVTETILTALDRRRFAWIPEQRDPSDAERSAAILATAALMASRQVEADRRNEGKRNQENHVRDALLASGFTRVATRTIATLTQAPAPGEFCAETMLGTRKADFVVGLWDQRVMPIECKVSNSSVNSIKRLNNDAAIKAANWYEEFGRLQVVPTAVIGGVFKLKNLRAAQTGGLIIIWSHQLDSLTNWIATTKQVR